MTNYRRARTAGGTYFFAVNLVDRDQTHLVDHVRVLKQIVRKEMETFPFVVDAMVVLPDHLHALWTLPPGDSDYSNRWRRIKAAFSATLPPAGNRSPSQIAKRERGLWQRRFWEHMIRDERDLQRHIDYIHYNPVKHGHVKRVCDWAHSTFHRYVQEVKYPIDWGSSGVPDLEAGEYEE